MRWLILSTLLLFLPGILPAQAPGQVVGIDGKPDLGNPASWSPDRQGSGFAQVTPSAPCGLYTGTGVCSNGFGGVGSGSLELMVSGNGSYQPLGFPDWAFFYLRNSDGFGKLQALSDLSFDWYRASVPGWTTDDQPAVGSLYSEGNSAVPPGDWAYKTPVLRLELREDRGAAGIVQSEIVWEGYWNKCALGTDASQGCDNNTTPLDTWVRQTRMQHDNFWYAQTTADGGRAFSRLNACNTAMSIWDGGMNSYSRDGLFGANGCLSGYDVTVVGIGVGVGNQWPLEYKGYADNVRMSFSDKGEVVNANFDFTAVPEPSTYALMSLGLLALAGINRRRPVSPS